MPRSVVGRVAMASVLAALLMLPAAPALGDEMVREILLPNNPVADALAIYEQLSGKILVRDPQLAAQPANVSLLVTRPLPKRDALLLLESALLMSGVALVPFTDTMTKATLSQARSPRGEGIPVISSEESLPYGDTVVCFYLPLEFLTAEQALPLIQAQVTINPQIGSLSSSPGGRALIVTEKSSVIRQVLALRAVVDQPGERIERKFVQLVRADADKVVELVAEALKETGTLGSSGSPQTAGAAIPAELLVAQAQQQQQGQPGQGDQAVNSVIVPSTGTQPGGAAEGVTPPAQLIADMRTNRIMIVAPASLLPEIERLIVEFDEPVDLADPYERPLQYAKASEVLGVLASVLAEGREEAEQAAADSPDSGTRTTTRQTETSATTDGGSTGSTITRSSLGAPVDDTAPASVVVGGTRIIADKRANSIIIVGTREAVSKAEKILDRLDQRPQQVYLSVIVGELSLVDNYEWSVDIIQKISGSDGFAGASSLRTQNPISVLVEPRGLTLNDAFPLTGGASFYGDWYNTVAAAVTAFQGTGRFRILSKPSLCVSNNKKAVFQIGREVPVPTSTLTTVDPGAVGDTAAVSASIDFRDVVLKVEVIPQINANREVTLQIIQTNDTLGEDQVISGNVVPSINTQQIETEVTVPDRSTIILGGLIQDTGRINDRGVPFIQRIPLIGYLFKGQSRDKERRELVVLVQPVVIDGMDELIANSIQQTDELRIGPTSIDFSADPHGFESLTPERIRENRQKRR